MCVKYSLGYMFRTLWGFVSVVSGTTTLLNNERIQLAKV